MSVKHKIRYHPCPASFGIIRKISSGKLESYSPNSFWWGLAAFT